MGKYTIIYSTDAWNDIQQIYKYITFQLQSPRTASTQIKHIYAAIQSLEVLPMRHIIVNFEPWVNEEVRKIPVNNYLIFYLVDEINSTVTILRIVYGGRNLENILTSTIYNSEPPTYFINEEREPYGTK